MTVVEGARERHDPSKAQQQIDGCLANLLFSSFSSRTSFSSRSSFSSREGAGEAKHLFVRGLFF